MSEVFNLSNDNKRYHTWNYYLRKTYGKKVYKIALQANFTCPNRDGKCGYGGCLFCSEKGSGDTAIQPLASLSQQFQLGYEWLQNKYPGAQCIAYFQSFTNTYAPLDTLHKIYTPFANNDLVSIISIATRADCLSDETIAYLDTLCDKKEVWLEIGLQSIHEQTTNAMNRGHDYKTFLRCIKKVSTTRLKVCVHLINSLPNESQEMMIESAKEVAKLPIHAVKIHMLHIVRNSALGMSYLHKPFPLLSFDMYIDTIIRQLEVLPPTMIIQRLTGDGDVTMLIAPAWTRNKKAVLNGIDKEMKRRDTWQGKYYIT